MDDTSTLLLLVMMSPFALVISFCLWELLSLHIYRPPADQPWRKT
jgi:hypothetical protein